MSVVTWAPILDTPRKKPEKDPEESPLWAMLRRKWATQKPMQQIFKKANIEKY